MHKLLGFTFLLAACPTTLDASTTLASSTGEDLSTSTSGAELSTGAPTSNTSDSTVNFIATVDPDLGNPTACSPTPHYCQAYEQWCPFYLDEEGCNAVTPDCNLWPSIFELCHAAAANCRSIFGEDAIACALGETKCLGAWPLEGCENQPAAFPCAHDETDCPAGWTFYEPGHFCQKPCSATIVAEHSGASTGAPTSTSGDELVTGGGATDDTSTTTGAQDTGGSDTGSPPPSPAGECGPESYSTCVDGLCEPHILILGCANF